MCASSNSVSYLSNQPRRRTRAARPASIAMISDLDDELMEVEEMELADYAAGSAIVEDAARVALHAQFADRERVKRLLPSMVELEFTMVDEEIDRMIDAGGGAVPTLQHVLKLEQRHIAFDEPKQLELAIEVC